MKNSPLIKSHLCIDSSLLQSTAADEFGTNASNNLIRVNVYYSSMNEKTIEDKIDYSVEVKLNFRQLNNS